MMIAKDMKTGSTQDGGYAWIILIASFILCFLRGGQFGNMGYFLVRFLYYYDISKTQASIIATLNVFLGNIFGALLGGVVIKRYGCRPTAIGFSLMIGLSYTLSGLVEYLPIIYIFFGFISGIGFPGIHMCGVTSCQQYFKKRRSFATGVCSTGIGLGILAFPALTFILDSWYGLTGALLITGAIFMNGAVCGALIRPFVESQRDEKMPEFTLKALCPFLGLCKKQPRQKYSSSSHSFISFYLFLLGVFLLHIGHCTMLIYTPLRANMNGLSNEKGIFLVSLIGFFSPTRFIYGWLGDLKWTNKAILLGSSSVAGGVLMIVSTFIYDYIPLAIIYGLFGLGAAGYISLQAAVLVDTVGMKNVALANGAYFTVLGFSNLLPNILIGILMDVIGNADTPFWMFGISQIMAGVCFMVIPLLQRKSSKTDKKSIEETQYTSKESIDEAQ